MDSKQIAETILNQMGGIGCVRAMLGAKLVREVDGGCEIRWPNAQRSRGNHVVITLAGDDTYTVRFFSIAQASCKEVACFKGVYADQLIPVFERQTGWMLRLGRVNAA